MAPYPIARSWIPALVSPSNRFKIVEIGDSTVQSAYSRIMC